MLYEITDRHTGVVLFSVETKDFIRAVEAALQHGPRYWAKPIQKSDREPWKKPVALNDLLRIRA